MPVQFNSIRPPGSRSRLVLKRDVIACSRPSDFEGGANRYKEEKKRTPCLPPYFFRLSHFARHSTIWTPERQKQILGLSEAETDQYCRFMSVMFAMNRQKFDERDQRYSNMHARNLVTNDLEQATWCYNLTPYPAHPPRSSPKNKPRGRSRIHPRLSGVGVRIMCIHVAVVIFYYVHPPL